MTLTRRALLRRLGGAALALPWMPSLARAADGPPVEPPRRFVFVFSSNGQQSNNWFPSAVPTWKTQSGTKDFQYAPLTSLPGPSLSPVLGPEFNPFLEKLVLIRGLDFAHGDAFGHFPSKALSGFPRLGQYGVTLDQVLAFSNTVYPTSPLARSVNLIVQGEQAPEDPISVANISGILTPVASEPDPTRAFSSLFHPTVPFAGLTDGALARRRKVLDLVKGQVDTLRSSARLGAEDRQRLEAHLGFIGDLEGRLTSGPASSVTCAGPTALASYSSADDHIPQVTRAHIDIVAAAIRCDLTRVATLQLCPSTDGRRFSFLPEAPFASDHHTLSHVSDGTADASLRLFNGWYAQQVAYLLEQLDVVEDPETGRTYLDNTVVYWGNEFGCNPWHICNAMPVLLAGGGGGRLRTGYYLDYRTQGQTFRPQTGSTNLDGSLLDWQGRDYQRFLVTLLQAMGLTPDAYQQTSNGGFGDYVGLGDDPSRRDDPLPFLLNT